MLHYDETASVVSYFRPIQVGVVNKVFNRNFVQYSLFQGLFNIMLTRLGNWSFSFGVLMTAYLTMLGGGYLIGTYVPVELTILLTLPFIYLMKYNVFFASVAHAMVLGLVISLLSGNLIFIGIALLMFLVARLLIDTPAMKNMLMFKQLHGLISGVYVYGFSRPLGIDDKFLSMIETLEKLKVEPKKVAKAYAYGHHLSDDEEYSTKEVVDFISSVMEGFYD